jgi:hypothetical protein
MIIILTQNIITMRFISTLIVLCFFNVFIVIAQSNQLSRRPQIKTNPIITAPVIDGDVLGDLVWKEISPITNLTQVTPNYGKSLSEATQIRVAFTQKIVFVSVVCFDSNPAGIVVSDSRRDSDLNDEDSFLFIFDTYNDQQNGFLFGTNADAMQYDAQIDNEGEGNFSNNRQQGGVVGGTNINWDASWEVKTRRGDFGWSAEFAIPLKSLRFTPGENKTWGINFQRNISKNSEVGYWASLPLGFNIKRVSMAGKLNGMDLKNPKNLKVSPYVIGQGVRDLSSGSTNLTSKTDVGADLKYSLTPGLTLDLTYNTDFAQVEVDEQQVNLDRFNLFFPEKRAFFLENAGQFSVGSPGEVDLFFSRRIGIGEDGDIVPIIGGGRISGKIGQTNVGLLNMVTDELDDFSIAKNNFSVVRVNHDFSSSRSSLGSIFVGKTELGNASDEYNRVYAIDGKLGLGKKADITGFISKSYSPNISFNEHAFQLKANYNWDGWRLSAGYTEVGEGFNPEVGFLMRSAFKKSDLLIFKQWRTKKLGPIYEVRPHISFNNYTDFENRLISRFLHIDNHWVWPSGFEIHTGVNFRTEGVFTPFDISGVNVTVGEYRHQEFQFVVQTNPNKTVNFYNRSIIGGYYGGDRIQLGNRMNVRLGDKFNAAINANYNYLILENGTINAFVSGARLTYSFSPKMFIQSLVQYNNVSNITSINARFGLLQTANTGLFVVLNIVKDTDWNDPLNNQVFSFKYSYQFDFL